MDTQTKLLNNRKSVILKQYKLNAAKDRLKKKNSKVSSIIYCNNDNDNVLITYNDGTCKKATSLNTIKNATTTTIKADGTRLSSIQVNKMFPECRCAWSYDEKVYVVKPGVVFEVSGCGVEKNSGMVDTNIYDVYGWGLQNTEKTDNTDLLYVHNYYVKDNLHTFFNGIFIKYNNNVNIELLKNRINKCAHSFFNNISYDLNIMFANTNMYRKYTVNNIKPRLFQRSNKSDGSFNYTIDEFCDYNVNRLNNLRPIYCFSKRFNNYYIKPYWLNIFTKKLSKKFFKNDIDYKGINGHYFKSTMEKNRYHFDHSNNTTSANKNYYSDIHIESYLTNLSSNIVFGYGEECYSYPGIDNACSGHQFTDPRGLLANVTNIGGGGV